MHAPQGLLTLLYHSRQFFSVPRPSHSKWDPLFSTPANQLISQGRFARPSPSAPQIPNSLSLQSFWLQFSYHCISVVVVCFNCRSSPPQIFTHLVLRYYSNQIAASISESKAPTRKQCSPSVSLKLQSESSTTSPRPP